MAIDFATLEPFIGPVFVPVLITFIGSNALTALLTQVLNRRKTKLTNKNLEIDGDVKVGRMATEIADGLRTDMKVARETQKDLLKSVSEQAKKILKLELHVENIEDDKLDLKKENEKLRQVNIELKSTIEHNKFLKVSTNQLDNG